MRTRAQLDASGGQLTPDSTVADLASVDFARALLAGATACVPRAGRRIRLRGHQA